ncbi:DUF169 domain-containing protein [Phosphitispora fastidiosa]|uniref:DUF169 domain-containing protein n=1 Tax=Phosphitispora fastidiosa TaxID=2837202 RepID=UPI001E2A89AC|nr:DUF169 domain-containing protein [Phosphitispora fastidiosa]MBU7006773.1 protein of unknown function (DUF169 family) [Phosphitispora fastidiosa]
MDGATIHRLLNEYLKLRTPALAFKVFESEQELAKIKGVRKPHWQGTMCQLLTASRTYGWTLGFTKADLGVPNCAAVIGLCEMPPGALQGEMLHEVWFETVEDAKKHMDQMPRIKPGRYSAAAISPLVKERFDPDIILVYGTPAQMIRLIAGLQWNKYERMTFYAVGETACADSIAQCYLSQKPSLAIPCFGERRFGGVMEDELVIALPKHYIAKLMEGLERTERSGIRYPIPFYGVTVDPGPGMPPKYQSYLNRHRTEPK